MFDKYKKIIKPTPTTSRPVPRKIESPALRQDISTSRVAGIISATFSPDNMKYVLDMGALTQGTVEFFGQFALRYDVVDLYAELNNVDFFSHKERDEKEQAIWNKKSSQVLSSIPAIIAGFEVKKYDAIFLWDMVNYLDAEQLTELLHRLKPFCHWKTNIMCLFPITREIPRLPMRCSLIDYDKALYKHRPNDMPLIKNPEHERHGLEVLTTEFKLNYSSLLKNGVKECLYTLERASEN